MPNPAGDGSPVLRDIVLVGGGHSHIEVLRRFGMEPMAGVRLTLICRDTHTPYSGMMPGYIAGHYGYDEVHIDLSRLARFAGARFLRDEAIGVDRDARKVRCRDRPAVAYDLLSINIGSTPRMNAVSGASDHVTPVKPIRAFDETWRLLLDQVAGGASIRRIAVVGGGAGGVEMALAMQHRLSLELRAAGRPQDQITFHLLTAGAEILSTHNASVRRAFERVLAARGVVLHLKAEVNRVSATELRTSAGQIIEADEVIWATGAGGAPWLRATGLALDGDGFIQVTDTLQAVADANLFAAGDVVSLVSRPLEKAGVFAVWQGPVLADNLRRAVLGRSLKRYRPQRRWLALISTGDRYAVASRGAFKAEGAWVWRSKDWIDRRFMARFSELPSMGSPAAVPSPSVILDRNDAEQAKAALEMRCGGCAAKVGAASLSRGLGSLHPLARPDVLIGLGEPDDAAVVRVPPGKAMVHTVDLFPAFFDDLYLFGKVAANHALGDVFAMGAEPQSATAIALLPPGLSRKIEADLGQMMAGAVEVLNEAGCALVGGHTGEGREVSLGFAVNGLIDEGLGYPMRKGGMRPGDVLLLTKALGTGTLFAAHARLAAQGRWIDEALASMILSNRLAAQCLRTHEATACTDVTGFGLLGHLLEMTRASGVHAEVDLEALPILNGAEQLLARGIFSSLHSANAREDIHVRNRPEALGHPRFPLIFDPQTAGGLLASVPVERVEACLSALRGFGYESAVAIGRALSACAGLEPVLLRLRERS
jgi:selenide,water dikinase